MDVRAFSWNLFHGRDHPPRPELSTLRSRLLRTTERDASYAQVNRDLYPQFQELITGGDWDLALLQEVPPRWAEPLAIDAGAEPHLVLTSRNLLRPLQSQIARLNPDLIASWEGGSNLTLIRPGADGPFRIIERRDLLLTRVPERRRMAFTRLACGLCIANLHASVAPGQAETDVLLAAAGAYGWAAGAPIIFGGDLNCRPAESPELFERLSESFRLTGAGDRNSIDHLLSCGLEPLGPPQRRRPEQRELDDPTHEGPGPPKRIRLSDHSPVEAAFALPV